MIIEPFSEEADILFMWYDTEYNHITIEELDGKYTLYKSNSEGEVIYSIPLNIEETIISMVLGENDNIYIGTEKEITAYSSDGKLLTSIKLQNKLIYISSAHGKKPILKLKKDEMYDLPKYQYVNINTNSLENIEMSDDITIKLSDSNILYGLGYDYFHVTNVGIYGYDISTNTLTKTLDFSNSDISYSDMKTLLCISPEKVFMFSEEYLVQYCTLLTHIPNDQLPRNREIKPCIPKSQEPCYTKSIQPQIVQYGVNEVVQKV